jgi:hypothetical protein
MTLQVRFGAILICAALLASGAMAAEPMAKPETCAAQLKDVQAGKALADVKLQEEYERSDAQAYLIRLELSVTKKKLADALAKCGAACAPTPPKPTLR